MLAKQTDYIVGIYLRLSKDDERAGESLSIENQRRILTNYVREQGWTIYDEYVDDGISGTTFSRPGVQRMLDDAKNGRINLIICKDLSRFGRNYIQVGQYTDYIFPMYNIRFIALNDGIDTLNSDSADMDMMPIRNVFNEWHAANTSKKVRTVIAANAKAGKMMTPYCPYGYVKSDNEMRTPIIDPYAAGIVRRIFEMYASGMKPLQIATVLNEEGVLTPFDYYYKRIGKPNPYNHSHLWSGRNLENILKNPIYIGTLAQLRTTTVSYKNHQRIDRDESEWAVIENNHEPIISKELWDKVREIEKSVSRGKRDKKGELSPLSGLLFCDGCGWKMRKASSGGGGYICGYHNRFGKNYCSTHYINRKLIEDIILADIQEMCELAKDEKAATAEFLRRKRAYIDVQNIFDTKRMKTVGTRLTELDKLIQSVYEDKVAGRIEQDMAFDMLDKYQAEKKTLKTEYEEMTARSEAEMQNEEDVAEFISRLKRYAGATELTREMCLDLIEYATVDENNKGHKDRPRVIHVYYKLIDKPLTNKNRLALT